MQFIIELIIENKKGTNNPEGSTIMHELMLKNGYPMVKEVRTGKLLRITIDAESESSAKSIVEKMCNELRLINPVANTYRIISVRASSSISPDGISDAPVGAYLDDCGHRSPVGEILVDCCRRSPDGEKLDSKAVEDLRETKGKRERIT